MTRTTKSEERTPMRVTPIRGRARETRELAGLPGLAAGGESATEEAHASATVEGRAFPESAVRACDPPVEPGGFAGREARTAARAYELWQQRGCPAGSDQEDWFAAEREIAAKEGQDASR